MIPLELRMPGQNYSWEDQVYRDFMIGMISMLEPRFEQKGAVIYEALQETSELYFIMNGAIDIGFELNKKIKNYLRLQKGHMVGAFNCTFNKKTLYTYTVKQDLTAFVIRKDGWKHLIQNKDWSELTDKL